MAAVTSPETSPQPRVYFQTPAGTTEEPETPVRKQGRVTVKYDRKELRKRLNLEEWIIDQLTDLYDCEARFVEHTTSRCPVDICSYPCCGSLQLLPRPLRWTPTRSVVIPYSSHSQMVVLVRKSSVPSDQSTWFQLKSMFTFVIMGKNGLFTGLSPKEPGDK
ncbi:hypothetical protein ILYODFUR_014386 [Ilyodon furcidens]|uniref:Protein phosphatase 1 regulatory subunit 14B n=1 Tax=Ilyodon furcidens TaxID=33524 RepID=A0ABV0SYD7_9TELE